MPDGHLHSVTASTMTLQAPPESVPREEFTSIGGVFFNLVDVAPPYRFDG